MGLDLLLGGLILVMAVRGWLRGFVLQAIKLAGVLVAVYLANPVRGYARPHVIPHLASVRPDLIDRLLWWAAAVASYVVTVGVATLLVKMQRRRTFGEPEENRSDQFAGFLLGATKGTIVAAFLVAGIQSHALGWLEKVSWIQKQAEGSKALAWNTQYKPAEQIWNSPPVQHIVTVVRDNGIRADREATGQGGLPAIETPASETAQIAQPAHRMAIPPVTVPTPDAALRGELQELRRQLDDPGFLNPR